VLENAGLGAVIADVGMLVLFAIVLLVLAGLAFALAFQYARRAGTLAQY
jgi:hypothetical protein